MEAKMKKTSAKSKVKEYIKESQKKRESQILEHPEPMLPLEDLYGIKDRKLEVQNMEDKLKETLRIVEEKEQVITQLRRSWQDLAIKYADAENTIDALRFGDTSALLSRAQAQQCSSSANNNSRKLLIGGFNAPVQANPCNPEEVTVPAVTVEDVNQDCSSTHWLEKVKNWKTESCFNLSQDSHDDSGFRGSCTLDNSGLNSTTGVRGSKHNHKGKLRTKLRPSQTESCLHVLSNDTSKVKIATTRTSTSPEKIVSTKPELEGDELLEDIDDEDVIAIAKRVQKKSYRLAKILRATK